MTLRSYVLVDNANSKPGEGDANFAIGTSDATFNWQVRMHTCGGGRSEGVRIIELNNGRMAIDVLPTRGMGIWRVRRDATALGWKSPVRGPVHPSFVPVFDPSGLGWLEGFDELFCRCGLESNGAPDFDAQGRLLHPLHGRIANLPAHRVELIVDEDRRQLTLRGVVEETRFHFQSLMLTTSLTTAFDSTEFAWTDEVKNIGGREATLQMLYHFNVGQPLLVPGSRLTAPVSIVAPLAHAATRSGIDNWNTMPPAMPGSKEQVFCCKLLADDGGDTRVLLSRLANREAVSLRFNIGSLPALTVWRNTPAEVDGYVLGIEPGTNFPNPHSFEKQHGRVVSLAPGEVWQAKVVVAWATDPAAIAREEEMIRAIQGDRKTTVHDRPREDWSATP